jgi:hypothetical protein
MMSQEDWGLSKKKRFFLKCYSSLITQTSVLSLKANPEKWIGQACPGDIEKTAW